MLTEKYLPVKLLERFDMKINVGKKIVPKSPPIDDFFLS
jgi:hypothetical protein